MEKVLKFFNSLCDVVADEIVTNENIKKEAKKPDSGKKEYTVNTYPPQNSTEYAIRSIANTSRETDSDFYKKTCCDRIFDLVKKNRNNIPDMTKSYAIMQLRNISSNIDSDFYKNYICDLIYKIASGDTM